MITNQKVRGALILDLKDTCLSQEEIEQTVQSAMNNLISTLVQLGGGVATSKTEFLTERKHADTRTKRSSV